MACIKLWFKAGTSAKPNYMCSYNLRDICHFPRGSVQHYTIPLYHTIIPYHAITGCDAVSDIAGHGKGSAWNAFCSNPDLLAKLGKGDFHDETYSSYPRSSSAGCTIFLMRAAVIMHGWLVMFGKCRVPEACPPSYK